MAEFYGTIQGNRGEATRLGTKNSGIRATVETWQSIIRTRQYRAPSGFGREAGIEITDKYGNSALSLYLNADAVAQHRSDAGVAVAAGLVREAVEHLNQVAAVAVERQADEGKMA